MTGVEILPMPGADAFDVLHYLYEEYLIATSQEHLRLQSKVRTVLHEQLYEMPYRYAPTDMDRAGGTDVTLADGSDYGTAIKSKPYVPPTDPTQLDGIVGQPMG